MDIENESPPPELVAVVEEARTVRDVATAFRWTYAKARSVLMRYDLIDDVLTGEQILDLAKSGEIEIGVFSTDD